MSNSSHFIRPFKKEREYHFAVVPGRFMPPHQEHYDLIKKALEIADNVLVLLGSHNTAQDFKNPFTSAQREEMFKAMFSTYEEGNRLHYLPIRDYYYANQLWLAEVQQKTSEYIGPGDAVALMGAYKDAGSAWLDEFPQWEKVIYTPKKMLHATTLRSAMFNVGEKGVMKDYNPYQFKKKLYEGTDSSFEKELHPAVVTWLTENYYGRAPYHDCVVEFMAMKDYKEKAKFVGHKWAPTYVTADAVVLRSGHILVIRRRFSPGRGRWALPGGFVREGEYIEDAAIRELKEETAISIDKVVLRNHITESRVFDYPDRSLRGRTITHAYFINLGNGELPSIRANDDADHATWMSYADINQNASNFFEDHYHIISFFSTVTSGHNKPRSLK